MKDKILSQSIKSLADLLEKRDISSEELTNEYIQQINEKDSKYEAYISINEEAIKQAKKVDEKRKSNKDLSPLAGIPMAVKDNICTKDMLTTCGSKMLHNYKSPFDATVVNKLKSADAIILGKLNMDEFAMGSSTESSYFKTTKNPHDINCVPGGSSGGSAAAVSANEAVYTLGSDTGGSVRQPASFCGVVGMKPTYGSISRNGLIAFASSLDQIGIMTRGVEDLSYVMNETMGYDPLDSTSLKFEHVDYTSALKKDVKGLKIALPMNFLGEGIQESVKKHILKAAKKLESMGAIIEEIQFPNIEHALPAYYIISSAEASSNLSRFDGVQYGYRASEYDSLEELYKKTRQEGFGQEVKRRILLGTYALSSGYYDAYYKKALQVRNLIFKTYENIFSKYDLILSPVAPTTAYKIGAKNNQPLEMYLGDIYTVPVNIAGLPAISINCGYDENKMPIGMQLIGKAFNESMLLRVAHAYESEAGGAYHV